MAGPARALPSGKTAPPLPMQGRRGVSFTRTGGSLIPIQSSRPWKPRGCGVHGPQPLFPSSPPGMTGFRILGGGSLASSLDLRYTRKSALALPPGKLRPASMGPLPKRPCTERADAPRPARRPTEAYPRRYGEGGQRSRRGCSGPRMPGSSGNGPLDAGPPSFGCSADGAPVRGVRHRGGPPET